jgi:hypothetical protein
MKVLFVLLMVNVIHLWWMGMGSKYLRFIKILSQHHPFLFFLPNVFYPCKDRFMDDYDGIKNSTELKYNPFENFDNF